jgi:hypothetical protein
VSATPGLQLVPAAMGIVALQAPLAQRWKAVPPMQFQAPSSVQGVPAAKVPAAEEPVPVPVPVEEAADVVAEPAPESADLVAVVSVVGAAAVAELPTVTKTPPGRSVEDELEEGELVVMVVLSRGTTVRGTPVLVTKTEVDVLEGKGRDVYLE